MHRTKAQNFLIGLLLISLSSLSACQQSKRTHSQQFLQFGTIIEISLASISEAKALKAFSEIETLLKQRHSDWHGWLDGSLSRFNQELSQSPDTGLDIPDNIELLILESKKYYQQTNGLFNPALGKLIAAWGFHDSTEADLKLIEQIKQNIPGMDHLLIKDDLAYSLNPYLQLDFGGIAKGLAIREIKQMLLKMDIQDFIINAGGDIYASGEKVDRNWRVAIENPFKKGIIAGLDLKPSSSIFTSGNYRRYFIDEGQAKRHHIIHPLTGEPSKNISAVSVLHPDPVLADAAATALMLSEKAQIKTLAKQLGIEQYLVITEDKEIFCSQLLYQQLQWQNKQEFIIHVQ